MKQFIFTLSLFMVFVSCKSETKSASDNVESQSSADVVKSVYDHPEFTRKYNEYIQFQNYAHTLLTKDFERYYSNFNPEKPLTNNNMPIVSPLGHITDIKKASKGEPNLGEIDDISAQLYDAVTHLNTLLIKGRNYYHKLEHEDDNFEKGKLLHKQTDSMYRVYYGIYDKFNGILSTIGDDLTQRDLESYKKEGLLGRYNMLASINQIDSFMIYINNSEDYRKVPVEEVNTHITAISEYATALEDATLDKEALKKEFGFRYSSVPNYMRELNTFIRQSKNFRERLEKNNWKMAITHPQIKDNGSIEKLSEVYSNLITNYNSTL